MNELKRKHIIETAMILFNEFGFHATPTSKIAKKAKISVGTLFNYFATKQDLIQAIFMELKIHSRTRFLELLVQADDLIPHDSLQSMWKAAINWGVENPEEFKYLELFTTSPFNNEYKNLKVMDSFSKFRESILRYLVPGAECTDYPEYYMIYIDKSIHAATEFILKNDVENKELFMNESFDLIWNGYANKR